MNTITDIIRKCTLYAHNTSGMTKHKFIKKYSEIRLPIWLPMINGKTQPMAEIDNNR